MRPAHGVRVWKGGFSAGWCLAAAVCRGATVRPAAGRRRKPSYRVVINPGAAGRDLCAALRPQGAAAPMQGPAGRTDAAGRQHHN